MRFVTAIYNGLHHTPYGGRLNRDNHYLFSLKCLAGLKYGIHCYTSEKDKPEIQDYLDKNNIKNVTLEVFELNSMKYHEDILKIKEINLDYYALDNIWEHRCVQLMWMKMFWLDKEAKKTPNDKIFWIDAGISHNGIFPKKYQSAHLPGTEASHQYDLIFTPKLAEKLDKLSDGKIFTFYCSNRQHSYPPLYQHDYNLDGSIVSGLFGGSSSDIQKLTIKFDNFIKDIISKNTLLPEELIFTKIYQASPEDFNIFEFGTWYHEDWDCYDPQQISFSGFFSDLR